MKRVCSLFLALALILGSVVVFASVKVSASEIIGYLYNGYDLPALPTDYDSAYVYSLIFTVGNNYNLIVSNKKATYSSAVGKYRCYNAKYCRYILEDGEWSLAASSSSGSSHYVFDSAFVPLWANYDLNNQNGDVWVVASEPVPIFSDIPNTPYLETSFDDQVVYIAEDETFNLFVNAENVNGTPSINWYAMRENEDGTWSNGELQYTGGLEKYADGCYIGGWEYIPDPDAAPYTIMFKAVVTNTVGDLTSSAETGFVILHVMANDGTGGSTDPSGPSSGDDTGGDSETLGKLEQLDTDIQEVQQAVADVGDKVDHVSDQLEGVEDQLEGVEDQIEESNNKLGQIVEDIKSLPERIMDGIKGLFIPDADAMAAQQEKWNQLLSDRFGAVYEAGEIINEIAVAFSLQDVKETITFPTVTVPLGEVDWTFGGWEVDVVPNGLEFLIEVLKKIIDIVCTFAFINAMRNRFDRTLEAH